jgi:hypothetical protein
LKFDLTKCPDGCYKRTIYSLAGLRSAPLWYLLFEDGSSCLISQAGVKVLVETLGFQADELGLLDKIRGQEVEYRTVDGIMTEVYISVAGNA